MEATLLRVIELTPDREIDKELFIGVTPGPITRDNLFKIQYNTIQNTLLFRINIGLHKNQIQ